MTINRHRGVWSLAVSIFVIAPIAILSGCDAGKETSSSFANEVAPVEKPAEVPTRDQAECCKTDAAPYADSTPPRESFPGKPRRIAIPDVNLVDQDGKSVRFYEDLVKGKVVAINFVFTSCKAACPLLGAGFSRLQERLGDRLGNDCALISVSVDPAVDRPERLKSWAAQYGARPGWTLVTASETGKDQLDTLLKALQVYSPEKTDHSQSVLVVDGNSLEGWSS